MCNEIEFIDFEQKQLKALKAKTYNSCVLFILALDLLLLYLLFVSQALQFIGLFTCSCRPTGLPGGCQSCIERKKSKIKKWIIFIKAQPKESFTCVASVQDSTWSANAILLSFTHLYYNNAFICISTSFSFIVAHCCCDASFLPYQ